MGEDAAHIVGDLAHDEAVEQGHLPSRPGAGNDTAGRQEAEISHRRVEAVGPELRVFFGPRRGRGDPPPGVLDRRVDRLAGDRSICRTLQPVFHVPDLLRDRGDDGHFALSLTQSGDVSVYHSSAARLHLQAFCRRAGDPYWEMLAKSSYFVPYTQGVKTRGAKISPDLQLRLLRSRSAHPHLRTAVYGRVPTWMTSPIRSTTRISMPGRRNRRNCCAAAGPAQTVSISSTLPRRSRIWERASCMPANRSVSTSSNIC